MRRIAKYIVWFSLLLTLSAALEASTHVHASALETAKCPVCVSAHSAAPQAVFSQPKTTFIRVFTILTGPVSVQQRLIAFALRVRPPPSA